jgi:hypothetical protein
MINDQEDERSNLNNSEPEINRGIELLLRNKRRRESEPKTFQVKFGKMIFSLSTRVSFLYRISF